MRSVILAYSDYFLFMTYVSLPAFLIIWLMKRPDFSGVTKPHIEVME